MNKPRRRKMVYDCFFVHSPSVIAVKLFYRNHESYARLTDFATHGRVLHGEAMVQCVVTARNHKHYRLGETITVPYESLVWPMQTKAQPFRCVQVPLRVIIDEITQGAVTLGEDEWYAHYHRS